MILHNNSAVTDISYYWGYNSVVRRKNVFSSNSYTKALSVISGHIWSILFCVPHKMNYNQIVTANFARYHLPVLVHVHGGVGPRIDGQVKFYYFYFKQSSVEPARKEGGGAYFIPTKQALHCRLYAEAFVSSTGQVDSTTGDKHGIQSASLFIALKEAIRGPTKDQSHPQGEINLQTTTHKNTKIEVAALKPRTSTNGTR